MQDGYSINDNLFFAFVNILFSLKFYCIAFFEISKRGFENNCAEKN